MADNNAFGLETSTPFTYGATNTSTNSDGTTTTDETTRRKAVMTDTAVRRTMMSNGFFNPEDFQDYDRFYIFPRNDPYRALNTTREYIFVTKPDLNIFANTTDPATLNPEIANDPFFSNLLDRGYGKILQSLQNSFTGGDNITPFVNLLSNYKISSLELSPISAGDIETGANMFGTRMYYRRPTDTSDEECDFSIEFKDTKFLDCYLWFKAYDQYEQRKYQGKISLRNPEYARCKILSDQMTIFKFIVGEDGESLVYWACIWGCYPKSVPRDTFSELNANGGLSFSINWHGSFQSDMDPLILQHFNKLVKESGMYSASADLPLYDEEIGSIRQDAAYCPYIVGLSDTDTKINTYDGKKVYKLRWRVKTSGHTSKIAAGSSVSVIKDEYQNESVVKTTTGFVKEQYEKLAAATEKIGENMKMDETMYER